MEIYSETFVQHELSYGQFFIGPTEKNSINKELDKMVQDSESLPKEWNSLQVSDQVIKEGRTVYVLRTLFFIDPIW